MSPDGPACEVWFYFANFHQTMALAAKTHGARIATRIFQFTRAVGFGVTLPTTNGELDLNAVGRGAAGVSSPATGGVSVYAAHWVGAPTGGGPNGLDPVVPGRVQRIVNIHNPSIEVHLAGGGNNTGTAIILAPGGGHSTSPWAVRTDRSSGPGATTRICSGMTVLP